MKKSESFYKTEFPAVKIGDEVYTVIEKKEYILEELEKTWVIRKRDVVI